MNSTSTKKFFSRVCLVIILLAASGGYLMSQPLPGTGPGCWPPPCIPIDGGISLLVAAGVAFGIKKTIDNRAGKKKLSD